MRKIKKLRKFVSSVFTPMFRLGLVFAERLFTAISRFGVHPPDEKITFRLHNRVLLPSYAPTAPDLPHIKG